MTVTYRIDSLRKRQPSETDPLLEALRNSPEWIREDIQNAIDDIRKLNQFIGSNGEHIYLLQNENAAHLSVIKRKEAELTRLHLKLACANAKIAGGAQ